jgi:nucleotide-binding universal stress UspA family protein
MEPPRIKRILVATDFLAGSRLALDYALAFAFHFKAVIVMVHALELSYNARAAEAETHHSSMSRRHAQGRLDAMTDSVRNVGFEIEAYLEEGIPSDVIPSSARKHHADLLVLGVYGVHRGLAHLLIGSNTEKILLSTNSPVMTIGAHVPAGVDPALHFNEILYFCDFTARAFAAAQYAVFLGKEFGAPIDTCHVTPKDAGNSAQLYGRLDSQLRGILGENLHNSRASVIAPVRLDRGEEFEEIIARAKSQNAALIVLGREAEAQHVVHLHTTFAYQLLSQATCPVISVPAPSD